MNRKKYKKSIKSILGSIVGKDLGDKIIGANFPEQTGAEKNIERAKYMLEKMIDNKKLTKKQEKELKEITGL